MMKQKYFRSTERFSAIVGPMRRKYFSLAEPTQEEPVILTRLRPYPVPHTRAPICLAPYILTNEEETFQSC